MKYLKQVLSSFLLTGVLASGFAQTKAPENWFNLDASKDGVMGVSTEETYKTLLSGKPSKTIIVAVLDSGVDYKHEDLKDVMWVNPGEIPANGIDDDKNGYIDDVHGWNFIGGKDGRNVHQDNYELTREYKRLSQKYAGKDVTKLSGKDKKEYKMFESIKTAYEDKKSELEGMQASANENFAKMEKAFAAVKVAAPGEKITDDLLKKLKGDASGSLLESIELLIKMSGRGISQDNFAEYKEQASEYFNNGLSYGYNTEFNPRTIVGDNPNDINEKYYGNNDVQGPDASHGTHVSGIIAASRGNNVGMKGVADNVRIMSVRCVPDGDERDKDVANAIIYAVDNGASIINMSFGKGYSPDKARVDAAIKYAKKHDVLLVHAAGNDSENNDSDPNFPNDKYEKSGWFSAKTNANWLEVGALSWKGGDKAPAKFSNFGKKNVDFFSPGVDIYSTTPGNEYASYNGTSMASPCAAGVAAVLRTYYPELTAKQVKKILMTSSVKKTDKVYKPGSTELVPFSDLSVSGGVVNTYNAVKMAAVTSGKAKKNAKWRVAGEKAAAVKIVRP